MWRDIFNKLKTDASVPEVRLKDLEELMTNLKISEEDKEKIMMRMFVMYACGLSAGIKYKNENDD